MNFIQAQTSVFLARVREIIELNLDNDMFDVSTLAKALGVSRSGLHRKLKATSGLSASAYICRVKLDMAFKLLEDSPMNITEIALECGFRSVAYFDHCFRKYFGYSPRQIRKEVLGVPYVHSQLKPVSGQNEPDEQHRLQPQNVHHIPVPATSFIGREQELKMILDLLQSYRIISLVGSGGCGKTRLACEAVQYLDHQFKDGIWFVDFSGISDDKRVVQTIAEAFHIKEGKGKDLTELLIQRLREWRLLLILDNCEHLAKSCARVAGTLIRSVPGLTLLITSRVALNVYGEKVWRIPSLSLVDPDKVAGPEQALQSDAIHLFVDRAKLSDPRFKLDHENSKETAMICKQLDGIPLALELVASRIRYMEPPLILRRLSGAFTRLASTDPGTVNRHKTLNAAINWSYELLTHEEKLLFRRLGVFSGGFDLEAVEKVCSDASFPEEYILDLLSNLVDRSMVNTIRHSGQPIRYVMLETIRQYGLEHLPVKDEQALRKKHLDYFVGVAESGFEERMSAQNVWLNKISLDYENMLSALFWAEKNKRSVYRYLSGLLGWFWARTGRNNLARKILGGLIDERRLKSATKARVLSGFSWANYGNFDPAFKDTFIDNFRQAMLIWRRLGDRREEAVATSTFAASIGLFGDLEKGLSLAKDAVEIAKEAGEKGALLFCLRMLSQALVNLKKTVEARPVINEQLKLADELDNPNAKFGGHHNAGDCAAIEGRFHDAEKEYGLGLKAIAVYGDMVYILTEILGIAIAVSSMGHYRKALILTGVSNVQAKKAGSQSLENLPYQFWQELIKTHINGAREKLGEELSQKYEAEGAAMELEDAISYALDFEKD
ncbi:helix-turn-helix domain-containing protein [Saccharicrinis sp. FJH54]|uniref:helix-turn-helix domain-containing protein n=1 Tax=Saccharicrinis sp. FJH54 TaxID=3344665 RepID=UPI0035D521AB